MSLHSFTHAALRVERLREAESFYCRLFGVEVAFREAETADGWRTLPEAVDWEAAEGAGVSVGLVMLCRDGIRLALEAADVAADEGRLSHLGLYLDEAELERLRSVAVETGCEVALDRADALILDDPFGVRWELNTFPYEVRNG